MRYQTSRGIQNDLDTVTQQQMRTQVRIAANPITDFKVEPTSNEFGLTVTFSVASNVGVSAIHLRRNTTLDGNSSAVVQSWSGLATGSDVSFVDRSQEIIGQAANYWLELVGVSESRTIGPQSARVPSDMTPPTDLVSFDASHEAQSGSTVSVGVTFVPLQESRFASCKVYVAGYQGVAGYVAVAQNPTSPFSFPMKATTETVTLKAVAVSSAGTESPTGITKSLTLGSAATVPAKVVGVSSTCLTMGTQIAWTGNPESNLTSYKVYRALYRAGFGAATLIATVTSTGASRYSYLDGDGTLGFYEYFVVAHNAVGDGAASSASPENNGSENVAPNVPTNQVNNATVDSVDQGGGTGVTIRVYGPAGVGNTWKRVTGFGDVVYPYLTLSNKSYSTAYYVCYNGAQLIASTTSFDVLPDGYLWCGKVTTVASGGTGGTSGGGGSSGGGGGCVEIGTPVIEPDGSMQEILPCSEWVALTVPQHEPVNMHPDTQVVVYKSAKDITEEDRVSVGSEGRWVTGVRCQPFTKQSFKVKRRCPGGRYRAGSAEIELHNYKQAN